MANYPDSIIARARDAGWVEWSSMDPQLYLDLQSGEVHVNVDEFNYNSGKSGERVENTSTPVRTYEGRNSKRER